MRIPHHPYLPLYNRYSKPPEGWQDFEYDHYFPLTVTALQNTPGVPLQITGEADFYWRGTIATTDSTQNVGGILLAPLGSVKLRFRDPFGNYLESKVTMLENLGGGGPVFHQTALNGSFCCPEFPEIYCPKNSVVYLDIVEYNNDSTLVQLVLSGVLRKPIPPGES